VADFVKCTFMFRLPGSGGWSEIFYRAGTPNDSGVKAACDLWVEKRRRPLVQLASIKGYRISSVGTPRMSRMYRLRAASGTPGVSGTSTRDQATSALVTTLRCATGESRVYMMRGNPDGYLNWDELGNQGGPAANITGFLDFLSTGNGWGMQAEVKKAGDPTLTPITLITTEGNKVFFSAAGLTLPPKTRFLVTGVRGYKAGQFRGTWRAQAYGAGIITAATKRLIDPNYVIEEFGEVRVKDTSFYSYPLFNDYDRGQELAGSKRVGREPDQPRGRSSGVR